MERLKLGLCEGTSRYRLRCAKNEFKRLLLENYPEFAAV